MCRYYLIKSTEPELSDDPYSGNLLCTSRSNLSGHLQSDLHDFQGIGKENLGGSSLKCKQQTGQGLRLTSTQSKVTTTTLPLQKMK